MVLESSSGLNNYSKCERIGKFNRYGVGILGNGNYLCFEKDMDTEYVIGWFKKKLSEYPIDVAICGYNLGFNSKHINDCINKSDDYPYLKNFLAL